METNDQSVTHTCPWWLIPLFDNPLRRLFHDPVQILTGMVQAGDTALDVGCGMGYFSLGLAELVGPGGQVLAADLQEQMLAGLQRRAKRHGLLERIRPILSQPERIGIPGAIDFALAFWMVHEVRHPEPFLREIHQALKPGGRLLVVEPKLHVPPAAFEQTVQLLQELGFSEAGRPAIRLSRAVLAEKR